MIGRRRSISHEEANMRRFGASITLVLGSALLGCGSSPPPQQLVDARAAYARASRSQARTLNPAELHEAKSALQRAEKQFDADAKSGKTVDLAYIAQRKAELAEAQAATIDLRRQEQDLESAQQQAQAKAAEQAKGELEMTRGELESERAARSAAEQALAELAAAGTDMKEEARGVVIVMPGALMFPTGRSDLKPRSKEKLTKVAGALDEVGEAKILVEGHTDSTGSQALNMSLSQDRADSVRDFLVSEGVPEDKITATGVGPARPIGDNSTAEGRAENRRVEIVVQTNAMPSRYGSGTSAPPSPQPSRSPSPSRSPVPEPPPGAMP